MSQFKKNGTMELETSIGYSFSLIKTEYKQNKIYQNKKKTKRTVNLSFQSALCQQSADHGIIHDPFIFHEQITVECHPKFPPCLVGFHKSSFFFMLQGMQGPLIMDSPVILYDHLLKSLFFTDCIK